MQRTMAAIDVSGESISPNFKGPAVHSPSPAWPLKMWLIFCQETAKNYTLPNIPEERGFHLQHGGNPT